MNKYIERVLKDVQAKNANEPEFLQAVDEVLTTLTPVIDANKNYEANAILERMVEPERVVMFRVPWVDDKGIVRVNRGYRIQMNSAIGPYKGGLRFDPSVNLSVLKANPQYEQNAMLERIVEPERVVIFRVPWVDRKSTRLNSSHD